MTKSDEFDGWDGIDWGIEIGTIEFDLMAIKSHNKDNPSVGEVWNEWPKDMHGIMHLPLGYIPSKWDKVPEQSHEEKEKLKTKWLEFAQFIDSTNNIHLQENTFTIIGNHGTVFAFDANMEFSLWLPPGTTTRHIDAIRAIRKGARNRSYLDNQIIYMEASIATWKFAINGLKEELGFCDFPSHVEGLELKQFESWSTFLNPTGETFPESLRNLIHLMIEDDSIWHMLHQQEIERREANEEWNRKWPNGRPDDWMYL